MFMRELWVMNMEGGGWELRYEGIKIKEHQSSSGTTPGQLQVLCL